MQSRVNFLRLEINKFLGQNNKKYEIIRFKTSQAAGKVHTIKVKTDKGIYLHLKVVQPAPRTGQSWKILQVKEGVGLYTPI
jgi:predicted secreted protein